MINLTVSHEAIIQITKIGEIVTCEVNRGGVMSMNESISPFATEHLDLHSKL
jgi:hypothetical protein